MNLNVNQHVIVGRLGADADVRVTEGGMAIANMRVATNYFKKKENGYDTLTTWHQVKAFARAAERAGEYGKKGTEVSIVGEVRTDSWDDQNGNKRYSTYTIANQISFGKPSSNSGEDAQQDQAKAAESEGSKTVIQSAPTTASTTVPKPADKPKPQTTAQAQAETQVNEDSDLPF